MVLDVRSAAKTATVVFLGKLGHGKTRLLNAVCDTAFKSSMTPRSCTTTIQKGLSKSYGIQVLDTPGFFSSSDTAGHTQCQKTALQCCPLSGVYLVVKSGRVDDMVGTLSTMMDFIGDDDVRIIITFVDAEWTSKEEDPIPDLVGLLDVPPENILAVGLKTKPWRIEEFMKTTLHSPRYFQTNDDHEAFVNTLHVGARKLFSTVDSIANAQASYRPEDEEHLWILGSRLIADAKELSPEDNLELVHKLEDSAKLATSPEGGNNSNCASKVLTFVLRSVKYPSQGLKRKAARATVLKGGSGKSSVSSTRARGAQQGEWSATAVMPYMHHKTATSQCDIPLGNEGGLNFVERTIKAENATAISIESVGGHDCSVSSTSVVDGRFDLEVGDLGESLRGMKINENRHEESCLRPILGLVFCCLPRKAKKRRVRYAEEERC